MFKKIASVIRFFEPLYCGYLVNSAKKKSDILYDFLSNNNCMIWDYRKVIQELKLKKEEKKATICHVIGSGWSLNRSVPSISDNDFIIGFNYAAIYDLKYDAYFFEFGGNSCKAIMNDHLLLCQRRLNKDITTILFKNVWEDKNELDVLVDRWSKEAVFVKDYCMPVISHRYIYRVINRSMQIDKDGYLCQLCSTVFASVLLAYHLGFEEIVIHGVDFGGLYFYQDTDSISRSYSNDVRAIIRDLSFNEMSNHYSNSTSSTSHPTATMSKNNIGLQLVLLNLKKVLSENGVNLYCASNESPSSNILPVYGMIRD